MSLFAVIYRYVDDAATLDEHRPAPPRPPAHAVRGRPPRVSGPLAEGGGPGALLIFRADVRGAGRAVARRRPVPVLGLIVEREIRAWNPAFGADRLAPLPAQGDRPGIVRLGAGPTG